MCKYAEPFARCYLYIGALDNHNAMSHYGGTKQQVLLENAWITHGIDGNYPLVITPATVVITITPFFG